MTLKNQCPPLTNRGVERTNKSAVEAVVDWVQVTFHIATISFFEQRYRFAYNVVQKTK